MSRNSNSCLLTPIGQYGHEVTRTQLEADLDTWLKVSRALELVAQCCTDGAHRGGEVHFRMIGASTGSQPCP